MKLKKRTTFLHPSEFKLRIKNKNISIDFFEEFLYFGQYRLHERSSYFVHYFDNISENIKFLIDNGYVTE